MSPSTIDLFLGIALAFFAIKGLFAGLLKTVVSLVAVIAAWMLSGPLAGVVGPMIKWAITPDNPAFNLTERLIVWVAVFIVVQLIGSMLSKTLNETGLSGVDKIAGLALGVATGVLVGCLPLFVINAVPALHDWAPVKSAVKQSFFLRTYAPIAAKVVPPRRHKAG
jgi:membrane protein required for colicin V production